MSYLYLVQGYQEMNYKGELSDVANVRVKAETEQEALEKAKKLVDKPHYRVGEITEIEGR